MHPAQKFDFYAKRLNRKDSLSFVSFAAGR
jgi:hypothetical protein